MGKKRGVGKCTVSPISSTWNPVASSCSLLLIGKFTMHFLCPGWFGLPLTIFFFFLLSCPTEIYAWEAYTILSLSQQREVVSLISLKSGKKNGRSASFRLIESEIHVSSDDLKTGRIGCMVCRMERISCKQINAILKGLQGTNPLYSIYHSFHSICWSKISCS